MRDIGKAPAVHAPKYDLLRTANRASSDHWENGITFTPDHCYTTYGAAVDCPADDLSAWQPCRAVVNFDPYLIEVGIEWNAVDGYAGKIEDLALQVLELDTSARLEQLMSVPGFATTNPTLAGGTSAGSHDSGAAAIAAIEDRFAGTDSGATGHVAGRGVIYISPADVYTVRVEEYDGGLFTKTGGNKLVVGNFAPGTVYGHVGEVDVYVGAATYEEALGEYRSNEVAGRAWRRAMAVWTPCGAYKATITAP